MPRANGKTPIPDRPKDLIQSAERAILIIEAVARSNEALTPKQIAVELALAGGTVYHLLNTLAFMGWVERSGVGYTISSSKIAELYNAAAASYAVDDHTVLAVNQLAQATGETVYAARLIGMSVVIAAVAEGRHALHVSNLHPGMRGEEHSRATGRLLLSYQPLATIEEFLAQPGGFRALTPFTVTDPDKIRAELVAAAKNGYAVDNQEHIEGVCCISVPIRRPGVAPTVGLSITMPAHRLEANRAQYLTLLKEKAAQLAQELPG